jgi:hypothetical protein
MAATSVLNDSLFAAFSTTVLSQVPHPASTVAADMETNSPRHKAEPSIPNFIKKPLEDVASWATSSNSLCGQHAQSGSHILAASNKVTAT